MDRYERKAARVLWIRALADRLADGPHGLLYWRWRASTALRTAGRRHYGKVS